MDTSFPLPLSYHFFRMNSSLSDHPVGVLLLNLGSPERATTGAVRKYLRSFLGDPRVLDMPAPLRFLILNLFILPFRPRHSARAYRSIWTERGSPLIVHTGDLSLALQGELESRAPGRYQVRMAMRYGNPALKPTLDDFQAAGIRLLRVLPLYPQSTSSTTGTVLEELYRMAGEYRDVLHLQVHSPYYDNDDYIEALVRSIREALDRERNSAGQVDHLLFSFHGLPWRHIQKSDRTGRCRLDGRCCSEDGAAHSICYRAQCWQTARLAAERLNLAQDQFSVAFQSRMGRDPWIGPATEERLTGLPLRGIKNLAVVSPAFSVDCLETLEELNLRGRETFLRSGGERFVYIPCLNSRPDWVRAVANMVTV